MSETKLLPCPFCGNMPRTSAFSAWNNKTENAVKCVNLNCPAAPRTHLLDGTEAAIAAWNRRALTPKQEAAEDLYEALLWSPCKCLSKPVAGKAEREIIACKRCAALAKAGRA